VAEFLPFVDSAPGDLESLFADPAWSGFVAMWRAQARWPTRPIVNVTWHAARAFCAWAQHNWRLPCAGTIDLPTSAEWEIAARRDTDRVYPWGDHDPGAGNDAAAAYAWQAVSAGVVRSCTSATPVGAFPRGHSPEGIWDLGGNVFEWCASLHGGTVDHDIPIDGAVAGDRPGEMVYRGGCWFRSADAMRVVRRGDGDPWRYADTLGFRVVCRPASRQA
jgi:iron(II)-dependent oxidoreductase